MNRWGIHWFRRDLRVQGNHGLFANWQATGGNTLGLFCFDSQFLARTDFSHQRFAFFLNTLKQLKEDLKKRGGDILVIDSPPQTGIPKLISWCKSKGLPNPTFTWNRDYEPFARLRDQQIAKMLTSDFAIEPKTFRDHLLFEPNEVMNLDGGFFQVYSPFSRKWFELLKTKEGQKRVNYPSFSPQDRFQTTWAVLGQPMPFPDALEQFIAKNQPHVTVPMPPAGSEQALQSLNYFYKQKLNTYHTARDLPAEPGTSRLSIYFKNGSLVASDAVRALPGQPDLNWKTNDGPTRFLKEIVWREFYYAIVYHKPEVEKGAFLARYNDLMWENNPDWFRRWQEGTTGFPLVDAGMRELKTTGWMHNRLRMLVASFLTKDLLIDWRWGENHFMKWLLDGDLAPNNGGWQWAASTGCDPQPYFRIFNPWLQSKKFDPEGVYIKRFIPELRDADPALLHSPDADLTGFGYPRPIVNHNEQRQKALALFGQPKPN